MSALRALRSELDYNYRHEAVAVRFSGHAMPRGKQEAARGGIKNQCRASISEAHCAECSFYQPFILRNALRPDNALAEFAKVLVSINYSTETPGTAAAGL